MPSLSVLANLPTGQYLYEEKNIAATARSGYILVYKVGHTAIGIDGRSRLQSPCFRGFVEGNQIVNATRVFPPYRPDSRWESQRGEMVDLSHYQLSDRPISAEQVSTLRTCIQFFGR